jgi:hypothetical protein
VLVVIVVTNYGIQSGCSGLCTVIDSGRMVFNCVCERTESEGDLPVLEEQSDGGKQSECDPAERPDKVGFWSD